MKKMIFAVLATAVASYAQAGSVNFDLRADQSSTSYNKAANLSSSSKYYFKTIRLNYEGKVNDDLSFRLRAAYNKTGAPTAGLSDNTQPALEFAYVQHKMSDLFTLTAGKIGAEFGGMEATTSSADLYLLSPSYSKLGAVGTSLVGQYLNSSALLYVMGAKGSFNLTPDQSLSVVAMKVPTATASSNASLTGLVYKGTFMDKVLKTQLSYHTGNGVSNTADKYELMSAGITVTAGPTATTLDYISSSFKADAANTKDTLTSFVGKFAYTGLEKWTPRVEAFISEEKVETNGTASNNGTNKINGVGAVVEYKPYTDVNFRYHLAYNMMTQQLAAGGDDVSAQEVVVGARLYADFLK